MAPAACLISFAMETTAGEEWWSMAVSSSEKGFLQHGMLVFYCL